MSAVREMVSNLVLATLATPSAVDVEVVTGCVVAFITFKEGGLSIEALTSHLKGEGAHLTLVIDSESHTGFLASETLPGAH